MKIHELKILPQYFELVITKKKTFELRKNDRNFNVGDLAYLKEYDGNNYTGRIAISSIKYILTGGSYGLDEEYCIFSFNIIGTQGVE